MEYTVPVTFHVFASSQADAERQVRFYISALSLNGITVGKAIEGAPTPTKE